MTRNDRRRSKQWRFSDSSSRFDTKKRYQLATDDHPISETFTRKIVYCKRCGNRVVSNVSHCPFCGKSLLPLYRRLWFWLIVVVLIGSAAVTLIIYAPRPQASEPRTEIPPPAVVGVPEGQTIKNLHKGVTVDCDSLLVTVMESSQELIASDGAPITAVKVQFLNKGTDDVMLYSTQWQLETENGERFDCYIGKTEAGDNVKSDLESRSLSKGETWTATLYFAAQNPAKVIFAPNALSYSENGLVTWLLNEPADNPDSSSNAGDAEDAESGGAEGGEGEASGGGDTTGADGA